jgi:ATP-dependent RNA helicase RhlE
VSVTHGLIKGTRLRTVLILGGVNINQQIRELRAPVDIVVATPGRLLDLLSRNSLTLRHLKIWVLDEADRMLDMGFLPDIKRIRAQVPFNRQTMLFSATFGPEIKNLTNEFLKNPAVIDISPSSTATSANVTQMLYPVPQSQKKLLLQALLELGNMTSALVFTRTKHGANKLLQILESWGKKAAVIHSNRSQSQRQAALQGFKDRRYQILVATDIAARGIDVKDISHVINYDVPRHAEDYVHRIGRTGRAEAVGEAFTLVSPDEEEFVQKIERFIKKSIPRSVIPDFPYLSPPRMTTAPSSTHAPGASSHRAQHPPHHHQPQGAGKRRRPWHRRRR